MTLSSFLTKLEQKAIRTSSSSSSQQQPQPYPQSSQYNFHPPFQPYNPPNTHQGPTYNQYPSSNGYPTSSSNHYNQPAYYPPQYNQTVSHALPQQQHHKPATRSFKLSYSSSGSSTYIKDPDTDQQVYITVYSKSDAWTGKSKTGLDQELRVGDKNGRIIGGWKKDAITAKPIMCIGEPGNGAPFQKLKSPSFGSKMVFTSPHDGREYEWEKGDEKFAFRLLDVESGEEVAKFDPHMSSMSMSKLGSVEMQFLGGEDWIAAVLITIVILVNNKVDDTIGKEVLNAIIGAV